MCFDRNINGNRDGKFLECDYLLVQRCVKLALGIPKYERNSLQVYLDLSTSFESYEDWTI